MARTIDYGIDLGTTNSCIARWENSSVVVFQNNDQMNVTPSAVHILKSGRTIVGRRAYSALLTDSENVAVEFKRWMGQKDMRLFPATKRELSAEDLSAEVIRALREDVRRQRGEEVRTAVITVPAAFGALQCEATARAAQMAGLVESPLLQEPIAAAIGYGARTDKSNQRWLVFDLGGGTLDIAVVSTRDGRLNVLEHRGNNLLGGKDVDRLLVENILMPAICGSFSLRQDGPQSARTRILPRLRLKAEEAKIDLSRDNEVVISLVDVGDDDSGVPIELDISLKRSEFEALIEPLIEQCCNLAKEAIVGARLSTTDIDRILLVGGPTQTPHVRKALNQMLGIPVDYSADPMTIVGRGAAIYASTLESAEPQVKNNESSKSRQLVNVVIAHDAVSSETHATVAGRLTENNDGLELKIDSDGGLWTSGWMKLNDDVLDRKSVV